MTSIAIFSPSNPCSARIDFIAGSADAAYWREQPRPRIVPRTSPTADLGRRVQRKCARGVGRLEALTYIEAMKSARLLIGGRVQGVGYRAWSTRVSAELGLRGWVRNRRDGSVEMLVIGTEEAVAAMIEMARHGPPAARVGGVRIDDADDDGSPDFTPRATE